MDIDGISYLMMAEGLSAKHPKRVSSATTTDSWSDMSDVDNLSLEGVQAASGVDETDGGLFDPDIVSERLSRSLDFDHNPVAVDSYAQFDSLDSSHERKRKAERGRGAGQPPVGGAGPTSNGMTKQSNGGQPQGGYGSWSADQRPDYFPASSDEEAVTETDSDQGEKIKLKLLTVWNNMKHGFTVKTKTNFKYDSPILLLGKCYCCSKSEREDQRKQLNKTATTTFERFKKDFTSKIWFTYRKDFPKLYGSQLTTDIGWGCMLRTGQMIIAQAFVLHYLGREWTIYHGQQNRKMSMLHHQIIRLFGDQPSDDSPFSIQKLVRIGVDHGKRPGDWYGPASVAYVLRDAAEKAPGIHPLLSQLCIYVAPDCTVYIQDVIDLCTQVNSPQTSPRSRQEPIPTISQQVAQSNQAPPGGSGKRSSREEHWRAAIILVPVRLGGESLNPIYSPCVQSLLAHEACLGIIGGRPKHSLYFVGWQDEKLLYLDPHFCQDTVDMRFRDFPLNTFHCSSPRKMAVTKMDPSCTLGFYCPSRMALQNLVQDMKKLVMPPRDQGMYPLFVFHEGRSIDVEHSDAAQHSDTRRYLRLHHLDKKGRIKQPSQESEDFVFL